MYTINLAYHKEMSIHKRTLTRLQFSNNKHIKLLPKQKTYKTGLTFFGNTIYIIKSSMSINVYN